MKRAKVCFYICKNSILIEDKKAMKIIKDIFKQAHKEIDDGLGHLLKEYPNNHKEPLIIILDVGDEELSYLGGFYVPYDNRIVIYRYHKELDYEKKNCKNGKVSDLFLEPKHFLHILIHELIHYTFAEFYYPRPRSKKPTKWKLGVSLLENNDEVMERRINRKWHFNNWLDEILTDYLANYLSEYKNYVNLFTDNVKKKDLKLFEFIKDILPEVKMVSIVKALLFHDPNMLYEENDET